MPADYLSYNKQVALERTRYCFTVENRQFLAGRAREFRHNLGISQRTMATMCECTEDYYARVERGEGTVGDMARVVRVVLAVSPPCTKHMRNEPYVPRPVRS